ncbi:unnamed protein product [Phytomonas sp. Hart1]|nr:unnamed protein product [Phytomonas sp. Hart1]|eukprot:CCW70402.1 unnamed protein product [Phytomonas sp. isolate Hart1]
METAAREARERAENLNHYNNNAGTDEEEGESMPGEATSIPDGESSIPGITANVSPHAEDTSPIPTEEIPRVEIGKLETTQPSGDVPFVEAGNLETPNSNSVLVDLASPNKK